MKKLIFSKKFLKTKLILITLIVTVAYHHLCKDKNIYEDVRQLYIYQPREEPIEKIKQRMISIPNENVVKEVLKKNALSKDSSIIPSKWVIEHLKNLQKRAMPVNLPRLPMGILKESGFKRLNISEFFNSKALNDLKQHLKSEKFKKYSKLEVLVTEFRDYCGIKGKELAMFVCRIFGGGYKMLAAIELIYSPGQTSKKWAINGLDRCKSMWESFANFVYYDRFYVSNPQKDNDVETSDKINEDVPPFENLAEID